VILSIVRNHDIKIFLEVFARFFLLSCEGVDIFHFDLEDFNYPKDESPLTTTKLLHNDDNPALVKNEEVKYYTLTAQVLTKIVFCKLLSKSGEYSHDRGCAPFLIYRILQGIRVQIPKLIIDFMLSKHLLILDRNLHYGMMITHLFKYLKIDVPARLPLLPLLILIAHSLRGCN